MPETISDTNKTAAPTLVDPQSVYSASLDVGVRYTGVSLWDHGTHSDNFLVENNDPFQATAPVTMFRRIRRELHRRSMNPGPILLVLEDYGYGAGYFRAEQAEMVGMFKDLVTRNLESDPDYIGMVFLSPGTIKKAVAGNGRATKSQMKAAIREHGYRVDNSHEADAIAVGITYNQMWDRPTDGMIARSIINE